MKTSVWIIILSIILCGAIFLFPLLIPDNDLNSAKEVDLSDVIPDEEDFIQYQVMILDGPTPAPNIKLYPKEKKFEFMIHPLSDYLPIGHYTIENNKLTLDCDKDDNVYVFSLTSLKETEKEPDFDSLETLRLFYLNFIAEESTTLPMFKNSSSDEEATLPFTTGASFVPIKVIVTTK